MRLPTIHIAYVNVEICGMKEGVACFATLPKTDIQMGLLSDVAGDDIPDIGFLTALQMRGLGMAWSAAKVRLRDVSGWC